MTSSPLTLEFPVPLGNLIILVSPCTFLSYPLSSPIHIFSTSLSAPVIPCTNPLSSLAFLCHHLCTNRHLQFSPVTPCTCLYHPCFPLHPLYGLCLLSEVCDACYTLELCCQKSWNLNYPQRTLTISKYFCKCTGYVIIIQYFQLFAKF